MAGTLPSAELPGQLSTESSVEVPPTWEADLIASNPTGALRWQTFALAVVIPMFRESARIATTLAAFDGSAMNRRDVQLVLVDDGSDDDTVGAVFRALPSTTLVNPIVVQLNRNHGKGAAVRAGMLAANADLVAFVDADLSMDPTMLDGAVALLQATKADVVVGHREVDVTRQPRLRRMWSLAFRVAVRMVAPTGVSDTQCACKVFTRAAVDQLFEPLATTGFAFDVEVLLRARKAGMKVVELPVPWSHQPGSTVNPLLEPLRMMRDVLRARRIIGRR